MLNIEQCKVFISEAYLWLNHSLISKLDGENLHLKDALSTVIIIIYQIIYNSVTYSSLFNHLLKKSCGDVADWRAGETSSPSQFIGPKCKSPIWTNRRMCFLGGLSSTSQTPLFNVHCQLVCWVRVLLVGISSVFLFCYFWC